MVDIPTIAIVNQHMKRQLPCFLLDDVSKNIAHCLNDIVYSYLILLSQLEKLRFYHRQFYGSLINFTLEECLFSLSIFNEETVDPELTRMLWPQ